MRRFAFVFLLTAAACVDMNQGAGNADGGTDGGDTTDGGTTSAQPCHAFRDIAGACLDPSCLRSQACDVETAAAACGYGNEGVVGACFGGLCMYPNPTQGCGASSDCPCGFCGADGHCYEDRVGSCGACMTNGPTGSAGSSATSMPGNGTAACSACLADCKGTGPSCCSGCGCLCEGECGVCH